MGALAVVCWVVFGWLVADVLIVRYFVWQKPPAYRATSFRMQGTKKARATPLLSHLAFFLRAQSFHWHFSTLAAVDLCCVCHVSFLRSVDSTSMKVTALSSVLLANAALVNANSVFTFWESSEFIGRDQRPTCESGDLVRIEDTYNFQACFTAEIENTEEEEDGVVCTQCSSFFQKYEQAISPCLADNDDLKQVCWHLRVVFDTGGVIGVCDNVGDGDGNSFCLCADFELL